MKYLNIYNQLIHYRKHNKPLLNEYTENHHIIPRSLNGSDDSSNIIELTGREHWIAHLLLHKIYKRKETIHACHMMAMNCNNREISNIKNSKIYEAIRKEHAKYVSKMAKQRIGSKNGSYGTMWICNISLKENKKIKKNEPIPEGWIRGRNKWNNINKYVCKKCGNKFSSTYQKKYCSKSCKSISLVGKTHLTQTKKKLSLIKINLYKDKTKNPAYGKSYKWINDGIKNKKLYKNEEIPIGYQYGIIYKK